MQRLTDERAPLPAPTPHREPQRPRLRHSITKDASDSSFTVGKSSEKDYWWSDEFSTLSETVVENRGGKARLNIDEDWPDSSLDGHRCNAPNRSQKQENSNTRGTVSTGRYQSYPELYRCNRKASIDFGVKMPWGEIQDMTASGSRAAGNVNYRVVNTEPAKGSAEKVSAGEGPLPPVESESSVSPSPAAPPEGLPSPKRPIITASTSFQRPRKRVAWRGKTCMIALPLDDKRGQDAGVTTLLNAEDIARRLAHWEGQGYSIQGFQLSGPSVDPEALGEGQSRAIYPGIDQAEREPNGKPYTVNIPNPGDWETYVYHIKEEKLHALGVSFGDGEILLSKKNALTPANATLDRMHREGVSESNQAKQNIRAHYNEPIYVFPYPRPTPPLSGVWTPQLRSQQGSRIQSPVHYSQMQSHEECKTPFLNDYTTFHSHLSGMAPQIDLSQPQVQSQPLLQKMLDTWSLPISAVVDHDQSSLPVHYISRPELENPVPRGHRHNLSESLQKEIDNAEYHLEDSISRQLDDDGEVLSNSKSNRGQDGSEPMTTSRQNRIAVSSSQPALFGHESDQSTNIESQLGKIDTNTQPNHKTKPSISKFNVDAEEFRFQPRTSIIPDVFAFSGGREQYPELGLGASSLSGPSRASNRPVGGNGNSNLNVEAPSFTPTGSQKLSDASREFSFSSSVPIITSGAPSVVETSKAKIFQNIDCTEIVKPEKKSKAIPIINPDENMKPSNMNTDEQEHDSGSITQADSRQKRIRRDHDYGDSAPLFATPSHVLQPQREVPATPESLKEAFGKTPSIGQATDQLQEMINDLPGSEISSPGPLDVDGKSWEPYNFEDASDAAMFNAARPGSLSPARKANVILSNDSRAVKERGYETAQQADASSASVHGPEHSKHKGFHRTITSQPSTGGLAAWKLASSPISLLNPVLTSSVLPKRSSDGNHSELGENLAVSVEDGNTLPGVTYLKPAHNHVNTLIQHARRNDSGVNSESSVNPLAAFHASRPTHILSAAQQRKGAPSPSPNRLNEPFQYLPQAESESADTADMEMVTRNARFSPSYRPSKSDVALHATIHRLNSPSGDPVSDWDDAISSSEELKFQSRIGYFDNRANDLIGAIVQQRLQPMEQTLVGIQSSLALLSSRSASRRSLRRSTSVEKRESDADDEDDDHGDESHPQVRSSLKDRKYEELKASLLEILTAQQSAHLNEMSEMLEAIKHMNTSKEQASHPGLGDIKTIVEEVVGKQMRGKSAPITSSHQSATAEKYQLQIAGLESMLKIADDRFEVELKARRGADDLLAENQRFLRIAQHEAAEHRESAEEIEQSLRALHEERQHDLRKTASLVDAQENLQNTAAELSAKNLALESTLEEYRLSSDQWREEIEDAKAENKESKKTIDELREEMRESVENRKALRSKFDRLQDDMTLAAQDIARDQSLWRNRDVEHKARQEHLEVRLVAEARTREKMELEIERLEVQDKEHNKIRYVLEEMQAEKLLLEKKVKELSLENNENLKEGTRLERELYNAKEGASLDLHRVRTTMEVDIGSANTQISKLHSQLEDAYNEAEVIRGRHELILEEASDSKNTALREAAEHRDAALQEHYRFHERTLEELKAQHDCSLANELADKKRLETHFEDRLNLSNEKAEHYQERITHLEEKLEIAKAAAHAAAQSAQSVRANSVPPASRDSLPFARGSDIPEKISPQALRESIMVLQEQLQERERRIEKLEHDLSQVDVNAPAKIKDQEIEITWLRELLGVRLDELEAIIGTLSEHAYDREAAKDAAIRLRANLQMEQQEKERAIAGGQTFPSLASISNLASTPRALPFAAAAAFGNWRKVRDSSFGNIYETMTGTASQTPSKASPSSFFSGLMTPPTTSVRQTPQPAIRQKPSPSRRPLQAYSTPPRQALSRRDEQREEPPQTPPLMRESSYDLDAKSPGLERNAFVDASDLSDNRDAGEVEPFGPRLEI